MKTGRKREERDERVPSSSRLVPGDHTYLPEVLARALEVLHGAELELDSVAYRRAYGGPEAEGQEDVRHPEEPRLAQPRPHPEPRQKEAHGDGGAEPLQRLQLPGKPRAQVRITIVFFRGYSR